LPDRYPYQPDLAREYLAQSSVPNGFRIPLAHEAGSARGEQVASLLHQHRAESLNVTGGSFRACASRRQAQEVSIGPSKP
jgi:hypothetical protein